MWDTTGLEDDGSNKFNHKDESQVLDRIKWAGSDTATREMGRGGCRIGWRWGFWSTEERIFF